MVLDDMKGTPKYTDNYGNNENIHSYVFYFNIQIYLWLFFQHTNKSGVGCGRKGLACVKP